VIGVTVSEYYELIRLPEIRQLSFMFHWYSLPFSLVLERLGCELTLSIISNHWFIELREMETSGSLKSLMLLYIHAGFSDSGRPSIIFACSDHLVWASVVMTTWPSALLVFTELNVLQGVRVPSSLYISLCTLRLIVTSFNATLGMDGWLNLVQPGLSPSEKHQVFLDAP
jgi:hypothetical protein